MTNSNPSKFTNKELADCYSELILYFENNTGLSHEKLSTRVKGYRRLCDELRLRINSCSTLNEMQNLQLTHPIYQSSQIHFLDVKNNHLKSIFYHLRNAATHAHIKRTTRNGNQVWYLIEHKYKSQIKMIAQIKKPDFWEFVSKAKRMKKA